MNLVRKNGNENVQNWLHCNEKLIQLKSPASISQDDII